MARKRSEHVVVDPVAAAAQLGKQEPGLTAQDVRDHVREIEARGTHPEISVRMGEKDPACALGHSNQLGTRFCAECGLAMDAPAPVKADLDQARPKPASQLTAQERTERDRQHADALRAAAAFEAQQPDYVPAEGAAVLIHFIEDGLTFAGQVWYRGQEIEIGPSHPRWEQARGWILLDRNGQIERYGKQYFAPGPWPGRRSYADGADSYQRLYAGRGPDGKLANPFAGPGEEALRQADALEQRRGRAVPGPLAGLR